MVDFVWQQEVIDWATGIPDVEEVWLFGSRARGTHRDDSDVDLAIVVAGRDADESYTRWHGAAWRQTLPDLPVAVDLQYFDPTLSKRVVTRAVESDGVLLFSRDE